MMRRMGDELCVWIGLAGCWLLLVTGQIDRVVQEALDWLAGEDA